MRSIKNEEESAEHTISSISKYLEILIVIIESIDMNFIPNTWIEALQNIHFSIKTHFIHSLPH